jgi:MazG family protein
MPSSLTDLLATIHTLRAPGGCPWDRRQTLASAAHHLLDEAAEVLEAALGDDGDHVAEELADLLFMVCFCCEILHEQHPADFAEVARLGHEKLIRRHPHVFGDRRASNSTESQEQWNEVKADEKRARGQLSCQESILKDLPAAAAPLRQAHIYQKNAAEVGFDWPDPSGVWSKVREELAELEEAVRVRDAANKRRKDVTLEPPGGADGDRAAVTKDTSDLSATAVADELGDLLFAVVNLARHFGVKADLALRQANRRFRDRFHDVESRFDWSRQKLSEASLAELEAAWQEAKQNEAAGGSS